MGKGSAIVNAVKRLGIGSSGARLLNQRTLRERLGRGAPATTFRRASVQEARQSRTALNALRAQRTEADAEYARLVAGTRSPIEKSRLSKLKREADDRFDAAQEALEKRIGEVDELRLSARISQTPAPDTALSRAERLVSNEFDPATPGTGGGLRERLSAFRKEKPKTALAAGAAGFGASFVVPGAIGGILDKREAASDENRDLIIRKLEAQKLEQLRTVAAVQRLQGGGRQNLAILAQQQPHVFNELVAGRRLSQGVVSVGGGKTEQMERLAGASMAMATGDIRGIAQPDALQELNYLLGR